MPELKKYVGKIYLWQYVPSLVGSIIFTLLFALATVAVGYKMHKSKTRFCLPFFLGGVCVSPHLPTLSTTLTYV